MKLVGGGGRGGEVGRGGEGMDSSACFGSFLVSCNRGFLCVVFMRWARGCRPTLCCEQCVILT